MISTIVENIRRVPKEPLADLARRGWLAPMLDLGRLGTSFYKLAFRGAGLRSGFLAELDRRPASAADLSRTLDLDPAMVDGLTAWLDTGVSLGELSLRDGRYRIRSGALKRLLRPGNDPVAAFTDEMVHLHHRLITETPDRLRSGQLFAVPDADPAMIARSSRVGEPWIAAALEQFVPRTGPVRLLEVGCGSGAHIRTAAALNPLLTAVGLELQEPAAELARRTLAEAGLADRVEVRTGDIRDLTPDASADLVTLHQNIYYFPEDEQVALLEHLAGFLAPGGRLLITTIVRSGQVGTATLDLWGAMTEGTSRLPVPDALVARLHAAGFADARHVRLGADGFYGAFVGSR